MKFYNRARELDLLSQMYEQSANEARLVVMTGRRRVGKTMLALEFAKTHPAIYLFVAKKSEALLCQEFVAEIKKQIDWPVVGEITRFKQVFELIIQIAKQRPVCLVLDEFQQFLTVNPSVFSDMQHLWDRHKHEAQLNLIVIGSIYSLMTRLFQDAKEPLFGRADRHLFLTPFRLDDMATVLQDFGHQPADCLLDYFIITGGLPKYIDLLTSQQAYSTDEITDFVLSPHSPFLHESKHVLIEEFSKDYGVYFSILELLSLGKTTRGQIESILQRNVGGHLDRLDKTYSVISTYKPIQAKPNSRLQRYRIRDNFLNFWFRYIHRHWSAVEAGNLSYIKKIVQNDYSIYSSWMLERYFHQLFRESEQFNRVGYYWDRKHQNEIDLVAVNDADKRLVIVDIKLNPAKLSLNRVQQSATACLKAFPGYTVEWLGLSREQVGDFSIGKPQ